LQFMANLPGAKKNAAGVCHLRVEEHVAEVTAGESFDG
jgi:hypothetical protein